MKRVSLCFSIIFSLLALLIFKGSSLLTTAQNLDPSSSLCNRTCGGITIPFPFGIGPKHCYLSDWYEVVCNTTTSVSGGKRLAPFLSRINRELVSITFRNNQENFHGVVDIKFPVTSSGCSKRDEKPLPLNLTGKGSPFFITHSNRLVSVGCGTRALVTDIGSQIIGCESSCDRNKSRLGLDKICDGYRCCQVMITADRPQVIGVDLESSGGRGNCKVAFLTKETSSPANVTKPEQISSNGFSVIELGWYFDTSVHPLANPVGCMNVTDNNYYTTDRSCICENGYFSGFGYSNCYCAGGYEGNPYLPGGCIDECEGESGPIWCPRRQRDKIILVLQGLVPVLILLFLVLGIWGLIKFVKRRRKIIQKRKLFKRNGGLLLKQQLTTEGGNVGTSRIFSSKELEKATDNFNKNRVLGQGGQGTVYKGMLVDGQIVAVKRSKVLDEGKVEEFINEVRVLSQINHRNIVKLMGCCLETEVPILVYEHIPNGDLFKRLHDDSDDYTMTWEVRLRIAVEIAGALAYLHSAASTPVYHRDVKTTNILLDEKYRAKVSDFGTSRSISIDQTHLTTHVAGTLGYLDPEYFQTSQFTDKSDVYGFGVVLVELITGEKPFSVMWAEESRGLASYFFEAMKENRVLDIVDSRIKEECKPEQVLAMAKLARRCLSLKGKKRPSMREVSSDLEKIRSSLENLEVTIEEEEEEEEEMPIEINIDDSWSVDMTAPAYLFDLSPKLDVEPLVPQRTWS
ncbi:unnamed protein product [Brassica oleracea]